MKITCLLVCIFVNIFQVKTCCFIPFDFDLHDYEDFHQEEDYLNQCELANRNLMLRSICQNPRETQEMARGDNIPCASDILTINGNRDPVYRLMHTPYTLDQMYFTSGFEPLYRLKGMKELYELHVYPAGYRLGLCPLRPKGEPEKIAKQKMVKS